MRIPTWGKGLIPRILNQSAVVSHPAMKGASLLILKLAGSMLGVVCMTLSEFGLRVKARNCIQCEPRYVFPFHKEIQVTFRVFIFHLVDNFYMLAVH